MPDAPETHYFDHLPTCSRIDHGILNLTVVYCPHQMSTRLYATHTDDAGEHLGAWSMTFGPFDGTEEIVGGVAHEVLRWVGIEQERRWKERE